MKTSQSQFITARQFAVALVAFQAALAEGGVGTGEDGAPGASLLPRGEYNALTDYNPLDLVSRDGSSYVAVAQSSGQTPETSPESWQLLSAKGEPGQQGEQGEAMQGEQGIQGEPGAASDVPGPQGAPGEVSAAALATALGDLRSQIATGTPGDLTLAGDCYATENLPTTLQAVTEKLEALASLLRTL